MNVYVKTAPRAASIIYGLAKAGGEGVWLLPANICPAVPLALMSAGRQFEFIDIDPRTHSLDVGITQKLLKRKTSPQVAGVIYVRSFGIDRFALRDLAEIAAVKPDITCLIDDQCLSVPKTEAQCLLDSEADVALFSTGYGKVLDLGYGGYAFLKRKVNCDQRPLTFYPGAFEALMEIYKKAVRDNFSRIEMDDTFVLNMQNWLPVTPAPDWDNLRSLINEKLPSALNHKNKINAIYAQNIAPSLQWPADFQTWRFNINVGNPASLLAKIFNSGLFASKHYAPASLIFHGGNSPVATCHYERTLNLFNDFHFDQDRAYKLTQIINNHAREADEIC